MLNTQLLDIRQSSGLTLTDLDFLLQDTPLLPISNTLIDIESKFSINSLYLCAHVVWESAWGYHPNALRYHNLFNVGLDPALPNLTIITYPDYQTCLYEFVQHYFDKRYLQGHTLYTLGKHLQDTHVLWVNGVYSTMRLLDQLLATR